MKTTTMNQEQTLFCKAHNLTEGQFFGSEKIKGSLNLDGLKSIPEGFSPKVSCSLSLNSLRSIPEGFKPIVGGNLYLIGLKSIPEGFNPTVGWNLYLNNLKSIPEGFNPTVGWNLCLNNLKSIPIGFNPTVGWNLYLNNLKSIPIGFNPTVGRSLSLNGLKSFPKGFNPTVGWNLYLNRLKSIPEWFKPTIGGSIYYNNYNGHKSIKSPQTELNWQGGKYILRDDIFSEVISHKGNIYKVKNIGCNLEDKITYLITDGKGNFSHGETLSEAKSDLIFKTCKRNKDNYKGLTLESALTYEDMIVCYRVITGACSQGTKMFCNSKLGDNPKESYSISEVIELTDGQWGNKDFKEFFNS